VLGATAGIIGSLQAIETVKILAGMGSALKGRLLICDFADMFFSTIDIFRRTSCMACAGGPDVSKVREKVVWLCGRSTANVNPEKPWTTSLNDAYSIVKKEFKLRIKSRFAVIFGYKGFEVTLFNGGRMLIRNVGSEKRALEVYGEIRKRLVDRR
jgi:hypothetical protein